MARLDPTPAPGSFEFRVGESIDTYLERTQKALDQYTRVSDALPAGEILGAVLSFPRGDGQALYVVSQTQPLILQHIPYGDAWAAESALIRGLTKADVLEHQRRDRAMAKLFGRATAKLFGRAGAGSPKTSEPNQLEALFDACDRLVTEYMVEGDADWTTIAEIISEELRELLPHLDRGVYSRAQEMVGHLQSFEATATLIEKCWGHGDLAAAVRQLMEDREEVRPLLEDVGVLESKASEPPSLLAVAKLWLDTVWTENDPDCPVCGEPWTDEAKTECTNEDCLVKMTKAAIAAAETP